jgi:hypothetical protein
MESPIVRARELRRYDLLQDAARHRLAASGIDSSGNNHHSGIWSLWVNQVCRARVSLSRKLRAVSLAISSAAEPLAER